MGLVRCLAEERGRGGRPALLGLLGTMVSSVTYSTEGWASVGGQQRNLLGLVWVVSSVTYWA